LTHWCTGEFQNIHLNVWIHYFKSLKLGIPNLFPLYSIRIKSGKSIHKAKEEKKWDRPKCTKILYPVYMSSKKPIFLVWSKQLSHQFLRRQGTTLIDLKARRTSWESDINHRLLYPFEVAIAIFASFSSTSNASPWSKYRAKQAVQTPLASLKNTPNRFFVRILHSCSICVYFKLALKWRGSILLPWW